VLLHLGALLKLVVVDDILIRRARLKNKKTRLNINKDNKKKTRLYVPVKI